MDDESTFAQWLELPKGEPVRFDALPILIAEAQHPGDSDQAALLRVAAEIHIEDRLKELVDSGELQPRNRIGMARHTFPLGRSLRESVFVPELDLAPLAEAFAIDIRFVDGNPGTMHAAPSPPPPSDAAAIKPAPVGDGSADAPEAAPTLTTPKIAEAFDGELGLSAAQWKERMGDMPKWLRPARAAKVKAPTPATWWPLEFARILLGRGATVESLNRKFLTAPTLRPWREQWQEQRRERNAFGG